MSEAIELYKADGTTAGIFYCSECRCVAKTETEARNCCGQMLCECGKKIERKFYRECNDCQWERQKKESAAKEAERFEKAKKITEAEYAGDKVFVGDDYYDSVEDAVDGYLEGQEPEYVWACKDIGVPKATSEGIVEHLLESMWDDADHNDLNGLEELDAAIEKFNEANKSVSVYTPDYSTAILVPVAAKSPTA
jgi:hypothetical protein